MKNVLIVEDEEDVAAALEAYLSALNFRASVKYARVTTNREAHESLIGVRYDLLIVDLLLLPPGYRLAGGILHFETTDGGESSEPLSHTHWQRYVVDEGGIGLVRALRRGEIGHGFTPRDVPVIVSSYFDSAPGYMNVVRRLEDYNTILVPKINKNPNYHDLSGDVQLRHRFERLLAHILFECDLQNAEVEAVFIRDRVRMRRLEAMRRHPEFLTIMQKKYLLALEIDLREQPRLAWRQVSRQQDYRFQDWYEDWPLLRDEVLLNPKVGIRVSLRRRDESLVGQEDVVRLGQFDFSPTRGKIAKGDRYWRRRLTLLAYLALATEPPAWLRGSNWALMTAGLGKAMTLPTVSEEVEQDVEDAIAWFGPEIETWVRSDVREIRKHVLSAAKDYALANGIHKPKQWAEEVRSNFLVSSHPSKKEGYYFNGDIEITTTLDDAGVAKQPMSNYSTINIWPSDKTIKFSCSEGDPIDVNELAARLERQFERVAILPGMTVEVDSLEEQSLLLNAPANYEALCWWMEKTSEGADGFLARARAREIKIIVAPSEEACAEFMLSDFERLANAGVHVIHTQGLGDSIPEAKVVDTIICRDYRIKFNWISRGLLTGEYSYYQDTRRFARQMTQHYEVLQDHGALGDRRAGSASHRLDDRAFVVTTSRSNKLSPAGAKFLIVSSYDPVSDFAWTVGPPTNTPSSCSPWHAFIYAHDEKVRYIIHTHEKASTYAEKANEFRTESYLEDGVWHTGPQILAALRPFGGKDARIAVLRGHGAVAVASTLPSCVDALIQFTKWAQAEGDGTCHD